MPARLGAGKQNFFGGAGERGVGKKLGQIVNKNVAPKTGDARHFFLLGRLKKKMLFGNGIFRCVEEALAMHPFAGCVTKVGMCFVKMPELRLVADDIYLHAGGSRTAAKKLVFPHKLLGFLHAQPINFTLKALPQKLPVFLLADKLPDALFGFPFARPDDATFLRKPGEDLVVTCKGVVEVYAYVHRLNSVAVVHRHLQLRFIKMNKVFMPSVRKHTRPPFRNTGCDAIETRLPGAAELISRRYPGYSDKVEKTLGNFELLCRSMARHAQILTMLPRP